MKDKRCVHIDFHTSEYIMGVGADFDAEQFKKNIYTFTCTIGVLKR